MSQRGRHRKAQAVPLPRMERGQTRDPRGFHKLGAKSEYLEDMSGNGKEVV